MGKPAAAQRTISMFTGMMDTESENARDGYAPSHPQRQRHVTKPAVKWSQERGSMSVWTSDKGHLIELDRGGNYNVSQRGRRIGTFKNIVAATQAAESESPAGGDAP